MIKIFGHKSPDTDATASAIIWQWYMTERGAEESTAYTLGKPNTEALFVLSQWGFQPPAELSSITPEDRIVIVDTNNADELPEGINDAEIVQIIDHHKLVGNLQTKAPIEIAVRPLASTASVMVTLMGDEVVQNAPEGIKGLILSCIISDTLEFRSPTTTQMDIDMAQLLAEDLGIDITEYAAQMFAAKSDVSHFSDLELIRMDSKKYEVDGSMFRVSVLETTTPQVVLDRQASLVESFEIAKKEDEVDEILLFVIDILNESATLLTPNDVIRGLAKSSFGVEATGDSVVLPGIVSRKKQIIPVLKK